MPSRYQYFYLFHIQYLGFRYHGWFKQPDVKTVQMMIEKTFRFVLGHREFKVMGSSRTDAKVSANHSTFELFCDTPITDFQDFIETYNRNLPPDIKLLKIEEVDADFNIIQSPRSKEYLYLFAFGEKFHPFGASLMAFFPDLLDIDLMTEAAQKFEGEHNFQAYCAKPKPNTQFIRTVDYSRIEVNSEYSANFFPTKSYIYRIRAKGFMRNQVRLMMGQLVKVGKHEVSMEAFEHSLKGEIDAPFIDIAPASGLILNNISYNTHSDEP